MPIKSLTNRAGKLAKSEAFRKQYTVNKESAEIPKRTGLDTAELPINVPVLELKYQTNAKSSTKTRKFVDKKPTLKKFSIIY
jgi:hypothetical protein